MEKSQAINGTFRKKRVYFSQVSNTALRDPNLSLKAKGLYSLIQSYLTMENYVLHKNYLVSLSTDKKDGFNRVWDELKSSGYLVQYQSKSDDGRYLYEYELLDEPRQLSDAERQGFELKEANRIARNKRKLDNQKAKTNPETENPSMEKKAKTIDGFSGVGIPIHGITVPINNTDLNNTNLNNTKSSSSIKNKKEDEELIPQKIDTKKTKKKSANTHSEEEASKTLTTDELLDEPEDMRQIITAYKNSISKHLSPRQQEALEDLLRLYGKEQVLAAIEITMAKATTPNLSYLTKVCVDDHERRSILAKYNPFTSVESHDWDMKDLEAKERQYQQKKWEEIIE